LLLISPGAIWAQPKDFSYQIAQAQALIEQFKLNNQIPGLSISVMVKGELVWSQGFGYADLEQGVMVDPGRTKFRIGSISKTLSASALAKLYEAGKVDLEAPIQNYVPDFPKKKYDINLRQLAGHLSGIRHYKGDENFRAEHFNTVQEGLRIFEEDTLLFEPESEFLYSSYAWNLLSAGIEGAAQEDFLSYMERMVFLPLGMRSTCADKVDSLVAFRSRFYQKREDGKIIPAPYVDNSYKWAGGGFISTSEDLVLFAQAHLKSGYLKAETLALFQRPQKTRDGKVQEYGIGWRNGSYEGNGAWIGHSGVSVGGISRFIIYPEPEVIVVILTNSGQVEYEDTEHRIAGLFMD
ncbi:MAG: serine hydrolase domain-containing protein, partial [Bacteroidota bacterium]